MPHSPLYECYQREAKLTEFAGWNLPGQFAGLTPEHQAVRHSAGLFDISHMGQIELMGNRILWDFNPLVPTAITHLQPGQAQYTVLLNPHGGIIDDIIIYHQGQPGAKLIVNAACSAKNLAWLAKHLPGTCQLVNQVLLALQGPQATGILQTLTADVLQAIPRFGHQIITTKLGQIWVARTGYTGEDGWEIQAEPGVGQALWRELCDQGAVPCGLAVRDMLRLEAGLHLYGQDMDETITPLAAGLGWLVDWDKGDFIGRGALTTQKTQGLAQKLVGLIGTGRRIFRPGYPVLAQGQTVGRVTSGTLSLSLGRPIGLAYVDTHWAKLGASLTVQVREQELPVTVVKRTFYTRPG
ncbi:glycine cleavage system aminomethyltransferase T [Gloeomargarita lithophora Alchichica-D10]|uniref:aminomethyltransferase n=1 Tax=Gloeomargarita lithophora Alchichica-D10 TaxID=1188229 RepID=A0A1J0AGX4_9CYAN|nr:glycine cleavage system aminomethyltransferase GcvT [Gloeomargarita lithophora]APB35139.1 glycine cleavage system aminomethyltransferase T [Gloeomargarita lithophora Alchichica-D10]